MTFAWPWFALLLPLYVLITRYRRASTSLPGAVEHPYLFDLARPDLKQASSSRVGSVLSLLIWSCLILALTRPQWIGEPVNVEQHGRALYLAVDLSESMLERDMLWNGQAISRYQAVQGVVSEFVAQRTGDFIGLVVFGSYADVQAPLTPDLGAVQELLSDLRPGMADSRTAIGDGLALAVKQLRASETEDRVIILLSDGENNSGEITPEQAAQVAVQSQIKVHTIGFGGQGSDSLFSQFGLPSSVIDEATLQAVAEQTDGRYFRAATTRELADVFQAIDQIEASATRNRDQRQVTELYWLALMPALLSLMALLLWPVMQRRARTK